LSISEWRDAEGVEFVLEFFESFIGELNKKFDALVGRLGVANAVGFVVRRDSPFNGLRVGRLPSRTE